MYATPHRFPYLRIELRSVDRVHLSDDTQIWRSKLTDDVGHYLHPADDADYVKLIKHEDFYAGIISGDIRIDADFFSLKKTQFREMFGELQLKDLTDDGRALVHRKKAFIDRYDDLIGSTNIRITRKMLATLLVKWHDEIAAEEKAKERAAAKARKEISGDSKPKKARSDKRTKTSVFDEPPCVDTFLDYYNKFYYFDKNLVALARKPTKLGCSRNKQNHDGESLALAMAFADRFYVAARTKKKLLHADYDAERQLLNRARAPTAALTKISPYVFNRMILAGATYDRVMTRYGAARARKEFRPLRYGSDITRPGEQVAFDDHECDLSVWLRYYKVFDDLTPGMQKIAETSRVWITVGVDVATGWVVSIKMSKRRSSRMVINAIEMAISDKSHLARMCGATMPWPAFPIDGFISDNGTEYTADEVTEKLSACEIERDRTPAEQPWLRGTCERTLRTLGEITLHGLPGKTFSNVVEKGDYSPEQNAALLAEQFYALLVRMVVDYHHLKISGPRRAAPYNAVIDYLNETRPGARKVSDPHMRRHIFGVNMKRVIHPEGIIVWGIRYNSDQLQSLRHMIGNERVRIHFHREDIRWISVQLKDRTWITVKNRFGFAEPIGLLEWIQARKDVIADATIKQKDNLPAMWEALRYRREVGDSAALSAGLTLHQPSDEDIRHSHKIMFEGADFSTERRQLTPLPALFFDKDHFLEGGFRAVKPSDLNPKAASKSKANAKPASPAGDKPKPEPSNTAKKDKDYAAF